ncbi:hypothetical protein ABIF65_003796 [Bradyrhizobium japonicum]
MPRSCANCRFYLDSACHRSPPVRLPRKFDPDARAGSRVRDETLIWGWPAVQPTDWCEDYTSGDPR